jgi:hypothetical protein
MIYIIYYMIYIILYSIIYYIDDVCTMLYIIINKNHYCHQSLYFVMVLSQDIKNDLCF